MRKKLRASAAAAATLALIAVTAAVVGGEEMSKEMSEEMSMPFGGKEDVDFAGELWGAIEGHPDWQMTSEYYAGASPHGMFVRLYYNIVMVDGVPHHVIVKDNFGGESATVKMVAAAPADYLMAVTVMVQMEPGYDPDNNDWYWVKYHADGSVEVNPMGMALAGRVAKGMDAGCIACHAVAGAGDYLFTNDPPTE